MADRAPAPTSFAADVHDVDRIDLHLLVGEGFFDCIFDLDFVGVGRDFEDVFALVAEDRALFRDDGPNDGAERV